MKPLTFCFYWTITSPVGTILTACLFNLDSIQVLKVAFTQVLLTYAWLLYLKTSKA